LGFLVPAPPYIALDCLGGEFVVPPSGNVGLGQPIGNQRESARVTRRKVIAPICPSRSLTGVNSLAKFAQSGK
jgi:hypothetical protein